MATGQAIEPSAYSSLLMMVLVGGKYRT